MALIDGRRGGRGWLEEVRPAALPLHRGSGLSKVRPYSQLRAEIARRDRSLREKVVSLEQAASFVRDGDCGRHWRKHDVAHPDGDDLGPDPRRQERAVLLRCITSSDGDLLLGSGVSITL